MNREERVRKQNLKINLTECNDLLSDYEEKLRNCSDPKERRRYKAEIKEIKLEIQDINEELDTLRPEPKIGELLTKELRYLNYKRQSEIIKSYFRNNRQKLCSFLIQGKKNYGQMWLVNSLLRHFAIEPEIIRLNLYEDQTGYDAVLREMKRVLRIKEKSPFTPLHEYLDTIIEDTCHLLENHQIVILLLNPANLMIDNHFENFWNKFWIPLCERVCKKNPRDKDFNELMLFMLDLHDMDGKMELKNFKCVDSVEHNCTYNYNDLVKVPELELLTKEDFTNWVELTKDRSKEKLAGKIDELILNNPTNYNKFLELCDNDEIEPLRIFQELYNQLDPKGQMESYDNEGLKIYP